MPQKSVPSRIRSHKKGGDATRQAALSILNAVAAGHHTLDRLMEEGNDVHAGLDQRNRALLNAIVYGVLRWRGRLDWIIGRYSRTPLERIDPAVLNILRMALFQVIHLDKIPESAAVDTAVELAKTVSPPWTVRFVNGVLRAAVNGYRTLTFPAPEVKPVTGLAVDQSFQTWMIRRWVARFGAAETALLCAAINTIPPLTLRANTLKTDRSGLIHCIRTAVDRCEPTPIAPDGVQIAGLGAPLPALPAFREGLFQVQDEAAQLVTLLLDPRPGETVLDACAGLGGKTGHMAQCMKNRGRIVAADRSEGKLESLQVEMRRLGVTQVETVAADLSEPGARLPADRFDRVLLDAPCSGAGVMRRNPDTKWRLKKRHLAQCARRQRCLLDRVAGLVKPFGILVYAVCSTEPEENEAVVKEFLYNHPEFDMDAPGSGLPDDFSGLMERPACMKTFPHRHGMDGFFAVRLKRKR